VNVTNGRRAMYIQSHQTRMPTAKQIGALYTKPPEDATVEPSRPVNGHAERHRRRSKVVALVSPPIRSTAQVALPFFRRRSSMLGSNFSIYKCISCHVLSGMLVFFGGGTCESGVPLLPSAPRLNQPQRLFLILSRWILITLARFRSSPTTATEERGYIAVIDYWIARMSLQDTLPSSFTIRGWSELALLRDHRGQGTNWEDCFRTGSGWNATS